MKPDGGGSLQPFGPPAMRTLPGAVAGREFILDEIRRVGSALGRAPGRREFLKHAGIKESDWSGRYWARWSDALREAGYEPNQLQNAHSDAFLLDSLVGLIREHRRFPTRPEMRMKRRTDSAFPDPKTFERFGGRAAIAERLQQHCEGPEGFEDVLEACSAVLSQTPQTQNRLPKSLESDFGFVYMIKSGRHFKIGRSNAVGRRERELAIQLPQKSSTVHIIRTDDPAGIERYWHQRFEPKRKNGEWFELTPDDVNAFRRRQFM